MCEVNNEVCKLSFVLKADVEFCAQKKFSPVSKILFAFQTDLLVE